MRVRDPRRCWSCAAWLVTAARPPLAVATSAGRHVGGSFRIGSQPPAEDTERGERGPTASAAGLVLCTALATARRREAIDRQGPVLFTSADGR